MREEKVSRDYSRPRTCSRKKTIKACKVQQNLDNIVLIDVDSDQFNNVIIIDIPESLQQKLRESSVLREGKQFPCIISIDDDESDNVDHPKINEEGDVDLGGDGTSSKSSPASDHVQKSVDADAGDCHVIWEKRSAFTLSKCKRTCTKKASFRNYYGLNSDSDSDSSEASTSDCEVMEGSFGELREQWEKASLNRKSNVRKGQSGLEDQASPCSSHKDVHSNVEAEYGNKHKFEASVCSSSRNANFDKKNSSVFTATRDGFLGGSSFNPRMENLFSKSDLKNNQKKSWEDTDSHWKAEIHCRGDASLWNGQHLGETNNVNHRRAVSKDGDEEFSWPPSSCNMYSHDAQCKSTGSEGKEKIVSGEKFVLNAVSSDDNMVESVVPPSENKARAVPEELFVSKTLSVGKKPSHQDPEKTDFGKESSFRTQCHETHNKAGMLGFAEGKEPFTDFASSIQHYKEKDPFYTPCGDVMPDVQRNIINEREKLKETDEYKRAAEEEWAARQRQLQIQQEEVRRLRKKRKAEILRILDVEKRQRQRVEEMRETQKKDEENLNMKERLRVEVRKELYKLEITCIDLASLLRGLGIHVEGGSCPLSNEVHSAYKRALLKFHPDRASRTNIRQQVEAEEKFKLISRMKEKF